MCKVHEVYLSAVLWVSHSWSWPRSQNILGGWLADFGQTGYTESLGRALSELKYHIESIIHGQECGNSPSFSLPLELSCTFHPKQHGNLSFKNLWCKTLHKVLSQISQETGQSSPLLGSVIVFQIRLGTSNTLWYPLTPQLKTSNSYMWSPGDLFWSGGVVFDWLMSLTSGPQKIF